MTDDEFKRLRELALKATPGPWRVGAGCVESALDNHPLVTVGQCDEDEQFIAAANPQAVLALLDRLEAVERERDGLPAQIGAWMHRMADEWEEKKLPSHHVPATLHLFARGIAKEEWRTTKGDAGK